MSGYLTVNGGHVPVPDGATVTLPGVGVRPVIPARLLRPGDAIVWSLGVREYVQRLEAVRRRLWYERLRLVTSASSRIIRPDTRVPFESLALTTGARLEFRIDEIPEP